MSKIKHEHKYHYFYQITNLLNGHFYYGIHSTNNLEDGYMGSGKRLNHAYKKYGIENFEKKILKFFNSRKELTKYEKEIVTEELILNPNCYNIIGGGEYRNTLGLVTVRDKNGNYFCVHNQDPRYLSGELVGLTKGFGIYYDTIENKNVLLETQIARLNKERYHGVTKGKKLYRNKINNTYKFFNINEKTSEEWEFVWKNKVVVKDKQGKIYSIDKNDERYLSGELVPIWKGKHHTEETKQKMKLTHKLNEHQKGVKNSQYGTCIIYNDIIKQNKRIKKEELDKYLSEGWQKGYKIIYNKTINTAKNRIWITNNIDSKMIKKEELDKYLSEGWQKGRIPKINMEKKLT